MTMLLNATFNNVSVIYRGGIEVGDLLWQRRFWFYWRVRQEHEYL